MALSSYAHSHSRAQNDGYLWMTALGMALFFSLGLVVLLGLLFLRIELRMDLGKSSAAATEAVATIYLDVLKPELAEVPKPDPKFARTSEDQTAPAEKKNEFIGERNTQATSGQAPDATAPLLPSQQGVEPKNEVIETTESRYQDGGLAASSLPPVAPTPIPLAPQEVMPTKPVEAVQAQETAQDRGQDDEYSLPPPREALLEGPNSVDVPVQSDVGDKDLPKRTPPRPEVAENPQEAITEQVKPTPSTPSFQGNQRKTAMVGSISRTGRSALNVDDTELGRYQALVSKAVELEWQRNCVRHRDFITPGFLTVRFFIETNGKIRSLQFVGDMETGEVQKGFTLNAIRDAEIPMMPKTLSEAFADEPLELIFRFYF